MTKFELSEQICESSLLPYRKYINHYSARDAADLIFLYFLGLHILKSSFATVPFAIDYARHTIQDNNFNKFKQSSTDLYILIHTLFGKDNEANKDLLKNQKASNLLIKTLYFDQQDAKKWLNNIIKNKVDDNFDKRFFINLETALRIDTSDYRSIRRLVCDWPTLTLQQRQLASTRLIYALKSRANKSEILPALSKLAKDENLFLKDTINPEEKTTQNSTLAKYAKYATIGALATTGVGLYNLAKLANSSINKNMKENASCGSTSAGSIAATPRPLKNKPILSRKDSESILFRSKKKDK